MDKICRNILSLPYSIRNVEKLVDLINDAKHIAEKNKGQYPTAFINYLQYNLEKEVQQLINEKEMFANTQNESFIIATFTTLKLGIHNLLSKRSFLNTSDLHLL